MALYQLTDNQKLIAKFFYSSNKYQYPLIGSVLDCKQDGIVLANNNQKPTAFFVIHKFGYSQIYGEKDECFYQDLRNFLFTEQAFIPPKIRTYAPDHKEFFLDQAEISCRCQFRLDTYVDLIFKTIPNLEIINIDPKNVDGINRAFGLDLFHRFWRTKEDFLEYGLGKVVKIDGEFASICYAAAIANGVAEIDVTTLPNYRQLNLAKITCSAFIRGCLDINLIPNWDCFTNNIGSVQLAKSLGFEKINDYCFFTLGKSKC